MKLMSLNMIDPAVFESEGSSPPDDIWCEACLQCGAVDNHGEILCACCDG